MKLESVVSFKYCMILNSIYPVFSYFANMGARFATVLSTKRGGNDEQRKLRTYAAFRFHFGGKRQLIVNIKNCKSKQFPTKFLIIS